MKFQLEIQCDNAAFEGENRFLETGRILEIAARLVGPYTSESSDLRDRNGNRVGKFEFVED